MKTGIVVQARTGSSRLPGKVLMQINDRTLLDHVTDRLLRLSDRAELVIATTVCPGDDVIEEWCRKKGVSCFRGDELNVLKRYYDCMKQYSFDYVVRMTADDPFVDEEEMGRLIDHHIRENNEFSAIYDQLPIGVGCEIFSGSCLEDDMKNASLPHHFEHVDEYVLENMDRYRHVPMSVPIEKCFPKVRLTVDTEEDYRRAVYIATHASTPLPGTAEAVRLAMEFDRQKD